MKDIQTAPLAELLAELRKYRNDKEVYYLLEPGLDPESSLLLHTAQEITGITAKEVLNKKDFWDYDPWTKKGLVENAVFGVGSAQDTAAYKEYENKLWKGAVDKFSKEIRFYENDETGKALRNVLVENIKNAVAERVEKQQRAGRHAAPTSLSDRLAAAKEKCAQQYKDRPSPKHDRGMER